MTTLESDFAVSSPAPALRPYIANYTGFRAYGLRPSMHSGLPTHSAGLIISLAEPIDIARMPDARQAPSEFGALVSGLQVGPTSVRYGDSRDGLFIHLTPPGVRAVLGIESVELSYRIVDFSEIWGKEADLLVDCLRAARTWLQRFNILDQTFLKALRPVTVQPELVWAWRRLAQTHGCVAVHQLAREIGWSRQHFGERFQRVLGVPPKTAARVFRFERAVRLIKVGRLSLAQIAAECGYHDQAHMTLEWNALAGCAPKAWIANELPFFQYSEPAGGDTWFEDGRAKISGRPFERSA
jgi:AraC-like DNA-binding protein